MTIGYLDGPASIVLVVLAVLAAPLVAYLFWRMTATGVIVARTYKWRDGSIHYEPEDR